MDDVDHFKVSRVVDDIVIIVVSQYNPCFRGIIADGEIHGWWVRPETRRGVQSVQQSNVGPYFYTMMKLWLCVKTYQVLGRSSFGNRYCHHFEVVRRSVNIC